MAGSQLSREASGRQRSRSEHDGASQWAAMRVVIGVISLQNKHRHSTARHSTAQHGPTQRLSALPAANTPNNALAGATWHRRRRAWCMAIRTRMILALPASAAMFTVPLARAASRLSVRSRPRSSLYCICVGVGVARSFAATRLHRKDVHGQKAPPPTPAPGLKPSPKADPLLQADQVLTSKEQRKADWAIMKEMSRYLWPKDNLGTRLRVGLSVVLLVGAKLLNVQVPFYFKSIVDAMNIDFAAVGGTATTVAGSMIVACKLHYRPACVGFSP